MSGFTDWFSVNAVVNVTAYIIGWYEKIVGTKAAGDISDSDSEEEWGQFVVIDEEKI